METRIRELRRARGLTLQDLADRIRPEPTTAQTIGRLETGARKISLEWLEKIADALSLHPAELLNYGSNDDIPVRGLLTRDGTLAPAGSETLYLRAPARRPVALKVAHAVGDFDVGDTVICETSEESDFTDCIGRDCLVTLDDGRQVFGRLIRGSTDNRYTVVSAGEDGPVIYDAAVIEAARPVMLLRHY